MTEKCQGRLCRTAEHRCEDVVIDLDDLALRVDLQVCGSLVSEWAWWLDPQTQQDQIPPDYRIVSDSHSGLGSICATQQNQIISTTLEIQSGDL